MPRTLRAGMPTAIPETATMTETPEVPLPELPERLREWRDELRALLSESRPNSINAIAYARHANLLDRALAALAQHLWRPIAEAPRDGRGPLTPSRVSVDAPEVPK